MATQCLTRLRRAFPGTYELVYDYAKSVVVAFGASERGHEAIVALAVFPDSVRLYFDKSLPDPGRLLEGSGSKVRAVTLEDASDMDGADIKSLIEAAIEHAGVSLPRTHLPTRMVIKSASKKHAARKTARAH